MASLDRYAALDHKVADKHKWHTQIFKSFFGTSKRKKKKNSEQEEEIVMRTLSRMNKKNLRVSIMSEIGKGHLWDRKFVEGAQFCDVCGQVIFTGDLFTCLRCSYVCHIHCKYIVPLNCRFPQEKTTIVNDNDVVPVTIHQRSATHSALQPTLPTNLIISEPITSSTLPSRLNRKSLRQKVENYALSNPNSSFKMSENGKSFEGFLTIHLYLQRPISVETNSMVHSLSELDQVHESQETLMSQRRTTFYLPQGSTKTVHATSEQTTYQVVHTLLRKFNVTDDPRKYALYDEHVKLSDKTVSKRKIGDDECPLNVELLWGPLHQHNFVLQENSTGDIQWENFTIPELENFLNFYDNIIANEINVIKRKYELYRKSLEEQLETIKSLTTNIETTNDDSFA